MSIGRPPVILLVEDQPNDVILTRMAVKAAELRNPLFVAPDGQSAVAYLSGEGRYADREKYPLPGLLLLDLKMPGMDGFEVLVWLQNRTELDSIAVVVLSSSNLESDVQLAGSLEADEFRIKPVDNADLVVLLRELHARWLSEEGPSA